MDVHDSFAVSCDRLLKPGVVSSSRLNDDLTFSTLCGLILYFFPFLLVKISFFRCDL